jgi:thioredoxin reductase
MKTFDWIIVGGGIAGISLSEILTREGHSVALIEKKDKLASATTREFHEWFHTGSLYTLLKDDMKTLKYVLGSLDDLLEFYTSFPNMNLQTTDSGIKIKDQDKGWFSPDYINFKYRLKNRKLILPWLYAIARSISLIDGIKKHDWLRRRAGILESVTTKYYFSIIKNLLKIITSGSKFYKIKSADFTINSRSLLNDMIAVAKNNGLEIFTQNELLEIKNLNNNVIAHCSNGDFQGKNVAVCLGGDIEKFSDLKINKSYAPIAVVKNIKEETKSFVELDCFKKNCINIITKGKSFGLIGGISLSKKDKVKKYFDFMIDEHKKINPEMEVLEKYVGIKNEVFKKKENRNYLFHIDSSKKYKNVWSIIPGKFTLAFSMAPEFYRIVYKKNPRKFFNLPSNTADVSHLIKDTVYEEFKKKE